MGSMIEQIVQDIVAERMEQIRTQNITHSLVVI